MYFLHRNIKPYLKETMTYIVMSVAGSNIQLHHSEFPVLGLNRRTFFTSIIKDNFQLNDSHLYIFQ